VGPEKLDGFSAVLVVNIFLHISSIRMLSLQLMLPQPVRRDVLADLPFTAGDVPQPSGHQPDRRFAAGKGRPGQRCHGAAHLRRQEWFSGQYPDRRGHAGRAVAGHALRCLGQSRREDRHRRPESPRELRLRRPGAADPRRGGQYRRYPELRYTWQHRQQDRGGDLPLRGPEPGQSGVHAPYRRLRDRARQEGGQRVGFRR